MGDVENNFNQYFIIIYLYNNCTSPEKVLQIKVLQISPFIGIPAFYPERKEGMSTERAKKKISQTAKLSIQIHMFNARKFVQRVCAKNLGFY